MDAADGRKRFGPAMTALVVTQAVVLLAGVASAFIVGGDRCGGDNKPRAILDCVGVSTAYIRTPSATGTGLLLADGYVVTNAHVVDPHDTATVVLGDERHTDVPLVGVDLFADVAVLGPVDSDAPPIRVAEDDPLQGDTVFLVGFPGEAESEPDPSISQGIVSRIRSPQEFGLTYVQTDASIGGGQSGGALVDTHGDVVGVSGLSFAENFALALDFDDITEIVERILDGDGDDIRTWPTGGRKEHELRILDFVDPHVLAIPVSDEERTVTFSVGGVTDPYLLATDVFSGPVGASENYLDDAPDIASFYGVTEADVRQTYGNSPGLVHQTDPDRFEVKVPAGALVFVEVVTLDFVPTGTVTANAPVAAVDLGGDSDTLELDEPANGTLGSLESTDLFTIDLEAGTTVEFYVGSPAADMAFALKPPGTTWQDATYADDSEGGLYGFDARLTYEVKRSGRHQIEVIAYDGVSVGYVVEARSL